MRGGHLVGTNRQFLIFLVFTNIIISEDLKDMDNL